MPSLGAARTPTPPFFTNQPLEVFVSVLRAPTPVDVLTAFARHMDASGVAAFRADGVYPSGLSVPAIFFGELPAAPDSVVAVKHYFTDPDWATQVGNPSMRFQLRWRGDRNPLTVQRLADDGWKALHTLTPGVWPGGLRFLWVQRQIVAPIDSDANGRWERCDSYEIQLNPIGA